MDWSFEKLRPTIMEVSIAGVPVAEFKVPTGHPVTIVWGGTSRRSDQAKRRWCKALLVGPDWRRCAPELAVEVLVDGVDIWKDERNATVGV